MRPLPEVVFDATRLEALLGYGILDTPPEPGYDSIVQLACRLCDTPVALVSLVAGDRQWFKARVGFSPCETDLNSSVCAYALAQPDDLLIIPDLTADPRTAANPLVTGEPFIRFYAGAPLRTPEGMTLGSLCVIDSKPRPGGLTETQASDLRALAQQVMTQLTLRRALVARDTLRAAETEAYRAREALRDTYAAIAAADGDLTTMLDAVVAGAMRAVPAADGAAFELVDGTELEYHAVRGTVAPYQGLRVPLDGSGEGYVALSGLPHLMGDADRDPYVRRDFVPTLQLGSAIFAPVLRGAVVLGVIKLQASRTHAFRNADLDLLILFASAATNGLVEAAARAEVRAKDAYWRGLFHRLNEGFIVGQVVRGADGRITDWRYLEVNPAWGELVGVNPATVIGRTIRDVFPGIEDEWVTELAEVVDTGEPLTFTRQVGSLRRWYEGRAFKLTGDQFGVIFLEVTERYEAENRRMALLSLGDRLRDLSGVQEMTYAAAEIAGQTVGAMRAGFGRVEGDVEAIVVEPDWTAPGQVSIAGRHHFDDYGHLREHLRRGEALVIEDITTDPRTRDDPSPMQAIGIGSLVNMPVCEKGRTVAVFITHDAAARVWTPEELAFLRNVADRVEVGVARVRAEEQQRVLNEEISHRLKNTLAMVLSIATQTLREVPDRAPVEAFQRRLHALSTAHDVLLRQTWTEAPVAEVIRAVVTGAGHGDRVDTEGPDFALGPRATLSLSLLLHELSTNAAKYGALSVPVGRVGLAWHFEGAGGDREAVFEWREQGGPPPVAPAQSGRKGFGSRLIRMGLAGSGGVDLRYPSTGFEATIRAPLAQLQSA